jgi:hypothetical protein
LFLPLGNKSSRLTMAYPTSCHRQLPISAFPLQFTPSGTYHC